MSEKTYPPALEKKHLHIQGLRIVAAYAVVLIHIIYQGYIDFPNESTESYLLFFNFLCFAVPVFVMITGWIWLRPGKIFPQKKCILKVLLPLFSYGILFSIMEQAFEQKCFNIKMLPLSLLYVIQGKSWAHLWYIYMLLGIYLCMPIIKNAIKDLTDKKLLIMIIALFGFNSVIVDIEKIFMINIAFYIPVSGIFIMYLLLGYYLDRCTIESRYLTISWLGLIVLIILLSYQGIRLDSIAYNDIPTVWLSINVYVSFLKARNTINNLFNNFNILSLVAENTFGIYMIHMIFINMLYKLFGFNPYKFRTVPFWLLSSLCIFFLSFIVSIIIKKMPVINKVFAV